jgi:hypothetical protein
MFELLLLLVFFTTFYDDFEGCSKLPAGFQIFNHFSLGRVVFLSLTTAHLFNFFEYLHLRLIQIGLFGGLQLFCQSIYLLTFFEYLF